MLLVVVVVIVIVMLLVAWGSLRGRTDQVHTFGRQKAFKQECISVLLSGFAGFSRRG